MEQKKKLYNFLQIKFQLLPDQAQFSAKKGVYLFFFSGKHSGTAEFFQWLKRTEKWDFNKMIIGLFLDKIIQNDNVSQWHVEGAVTVVPY